MENSALAWQAILDYENGTAGFADCLLAAVNQQYGCDVTYTFDQRAAKNRPGAKLKALLDSDFVGCGEGPEDGSINYKKYVADYLDDKYPDR